MPQNSPQNDSKKEEKLVPQLIEDEMKTSYLNYAMSVIVGRALPDVRDGLKPVHRRILFAMNEMGMYHNKPFKKSARIVGEVLGKYHPHGDTAVYDSIVRMVQNFSLRYPLIQGQGNFGSVDGDSAAAMRYCVTGDTILPTDSGFIEIRDISHKKETKINMKIQNYQNKIKNAVKFFNSGKHSTIKLVTQQGYELEGSFNHPILTWSYENGVPHIKWKLLEEITKSDVIIIDRKSNLFSKKSLDLSRLHPKTEARTKDFALPKVMNEELAFLLGALVSEGSFHNGQILFNNSDMEFYNKVKNAVYNQFEGINIYERRLKTSNCLELSIYYKQIVTFLKNIGLTSVKSDKKEIPYSVLQSKKEHISSFLKGLFEGDGSVRYKTDKRHGGNSIELTYDSKSEKLIKQLKTILLSFGIITTSPYVDKRNNCYKLIISDVSNIKKFKDEIGFLCSRKNEILNKVEKLNENKMSKNDSIPFLNEYLRKNYDKEFIKKNNFDRYNKLKNNYNKLIKLINIQDKRLIDEILKNNYFFDSIKLVLKTKKKKTVYSIKVDSKCHSFVANGFINHNTEARLAKISQEMLTDIDKETVRMAPNFDDSLKEPTVLPAKLPNLLINGSSGIAVGMATNIPPHNITEVCDGTMHVLDNPEAGIMEITNHIKGPDFPTGAVISGHNGILSAYKTGRGKVIVKATYRIEEKGNKQKMIIDQIPYMVNKSSLIEEIAENVKEKRIEGISDLRDESSRDGMRIILELKKGTNTDVLANQLYKHTRCKVTFGILMIALVNNEPKVLNIKEVIEHYIDHRKDIITKRTKFDLKKAEEKKHILEGIIIALDHISAVIEKIKKSKTVDDAQKRLVSDYKLSVAQAKAILEMRLSKLASLEQQKIKDEHKGLLKLIEELKAILASGEKIKSIIRSELLKIKEEYGDERKTQIVEGEEDDIEIEDLIEREDMVVTVSHEGYIKRLPINTYREQRRGGKGIIAAQTRDEDFIEHLFIANTHAYMLFFTNIGKIHWLKVYRIPEGSRQAKGRPIVNMLSLQEGEKVQAFIPVEVFDDNHFLIFGTKKGTVKKTNLSLYSRPRAGGIIAINLVDGDGLINVVKTDGQEQIMIATKNGMAVKFNEKDARPLGRNSMGVRGVRLKGDDEVVGMLRASDEDTVLTITENGFGKRTKISDYRLTRRGGVGVKNIICSERNGHVIGVRNVIDEDSLMFVSHNGIIIRTRADQISTIGRATQGVRIMRMKEDDKVVSLAKIVSEENGEDEVKETKE